MKSKSSETFQRFGKAFQEKFCHLMLSDRPFCDQVSEVLNVEFLDYEYLRVFVQILVGYRGKYKVHPSYDIMESRIRTECNKYTKALKEQLLKFYASILSTDRIENSQYIKDSSIDFCRKQVLKGAMMKSVKLIKSSSFDEIQKVIEEALKLGTDNNFGHDFLKDFEDRYTITSRDPVSTGFERVDEICKGGLGKSELGVVIAPRGAGKSMVLVHLGSEALKQGKTVVHYTLELQDTVVGNRYDSCISGVHLGDLFASKNEVLMKIKDIPGQLIIKEYPTKSASTETLKQHIERLRKRGIEPDMVIVDYADLLRPTRSSAEKRYDLENTYEELRAIAQIYKCPVWTASQTNRSGLNAEVITMEAISEAFNKCFVADFICSLSRTVQDKQANKGRVFIAKNRNGPDGLIFPAFVDWSNVNIQILKSEKEESIADVIKDKETDTLAFLRDKYKKSKK
ncbi:MAG: DnaB-like helicase C-terminal domain-containing protein [Candidatus Kariarchaeaceae archaeon]|jgi:replicative DNA helicase